MRVLQFICKECRGQESRALAKGERRPYMCPHCGVEVTTYTIRFSHNRQVRHPGKENRVDLLMRDNERWSDAMGCAPNQVPEFQKRWPFMEFDSEGRCKVKNRHHKKKIMKARGYYD